MSKVFQIFILPPSFRTCFLYLSNNDFNNLNDNKKTVEIRYGTNFENITYGSISLTPVPEIPEKYIGISSLYASRLNLVENDTITITFCDADAIDQLEISPTKEEDYVILLSCKTILETYLLNQVSIVAEGQILPLYVFSNISIDVEIGKINLPSKYGELQKFTEITVLHPSENPNSTTKTNNTPENKCKNNQKRNIYDELNKILENNIDLDQIEEQKRAEIFLKHIIEDNTPTNSEYKIQPFFMLPNNLSNIQNKYVIVSNLKILQNTYGSYCCKILGKIEKINDVDENTTENFLYCNVVSLGGDEDNVVFCPLWIMKKLGLTIGSTIRIEQIKPTTQIEVLKCSVKPNLIEHECFWDSIKTIRANIKQTMENNIKFNNRINTLVLGDTGCGKTFLLENIVMEFKNNFIFYEMMHCKNLRGKKVDKLHDLLTAALKNCSKHEPSILILDDLHAVTYIDDEENKSDKIYSEQVVDLISDLVEEFQRSYNITVIASALNLTQLSSFIFQHGPRLFQNVVLIPELSLQDRTFALNNIISCHNCAIDLDKISKSTNGYTIQDLNDLVKKAIFNSVLKKETVSSVDQSDFDLALSELIPLNLRSAKLKQKTATNWDDVGGMTEPKKILLEVFSWPLKYPELLGSCPLRIQRGVLLYGAPGTGKTLLAGALSNQCGLNFISVKGPEVLSKYVGASEEGIRNLFVEAQKSQPCLLFFDEFDSLAPKRGHDNTGVTDRVVNQLLTQLDGVEALNGVWVLAATSRPDLLDSALLRPGRLDKLVFCDVPDEADRLSILEVLSSKLSKADDVDLSELSKLTDGYTGADLQAVLYNAQMSAIKENKNSFNKVTDLKIDRLHFLKAIKEVKPSLSEREKLKYKNIYDKFMNSRKKNFVENEQLVQRVTLA